MPQIQGMAPLHNMLYAKMGEIQLCADILSLDQGLIESRPSSWIINNNGRDPFCVLSSRDSGALRYRLFMLLANMRIDAKVEGPQGPP